MHSPWAPTNFVARAADDDDWPPVHIGLVVHVPLPRVILPPHHVQGHIAGPARVRVAQSTRGTARNVGASIRYARGSQDSDGCHTGPSRSVSPFWHTSCELQAPQAPVWWSAAGNTSASTPPQRQHDASRTRAVHHQADCLIDCEACETAPLSFTPFASHPLRVPLRVDYSHPTPGTLQ